MDHKYPHLKDQLYIQFSLSLIHISEPTRLRRISYAVFCLKKKVEPKNFTKNPILGTKFTIAISSAKGGVGKSTFATNLALALKKVGCKVGLLDADIYGPSIPKMFDINEKPKSDGQKLDPITKYDIQCMSIGFLADQQTPMIWRLSLIHI